MIPPPLEAWPVAILVAGVLLLSGYVFYRKRQPTFADIL